MTAADGEMEGRGVGGIVDAIVGGERGDGWGCDSSSH